MYRRTVIKSVRIRNLRSAKDLTLEMGRLNCLVGPNGSGKSSILGAFQILTEYASRGYDATGEIAKAAGSHSPPGRDSGLLLGLDFEGDISDSSGEVRAFSYSLEISRQQRGWTSVSREWFRYTDHDKIVTLLEYPSKTAGGMAQFYREDGTPSMGIGVGAGGQSPLGMAAQQVEDTTFSRFAREVLSWYHLSLTPQYAKESEPAKRQHRLDISGTNLSAVLHSIHSEDYQTFLRIVETLRAAVPEIESVQVPITSEGTTHIQIHEAGVRHPLPIWALSEGTIALLQLFTVLEMKDPPPLITIDEPENFVHPGLISNIVESLKHASGSSQVLVATHSPFLVNLLQPSELFIVEKVEGATNVRAASSQNGIAEAVRLLGLGELWRTGAIGGVP
ncbi:MAG TPA: AAA family ATPase [Nitrospira sp.]|nr:AAA family ATPase [Nitrospira sp.]